MSNSPVIEPQQQRSLDSTRRLLDAATELIAENGFAEATFAAISERAGFSRGIVSTRFGSKEGLLWALVERSTEPWMPLVTARDATGTGLDRIIVLVRAIGEHARHDPQALRVLQRVIIEAAESSPGLQARMEHAVEVIREYARSLFDQGIRDGSVRSTVNAPVAADLLVVTLRGISYQWFLYPDQVDVVSLHDGLVDFVTAAYSSRQP
ncbi:MAG: TetR/AcrR family transcriptional regulator [Microthrixaceae bacterium]